MEQQERALAAYVDSVRERPGSLAVIVVGSVARGEEREDSDVDVYLVVDEETFAAETAADRYAWIERAGLD
ncbi:nucleotidyltransferase domain-containing protein [Microbacterium sp. RU33B]|uniref:nucleotidyltransferase domain-containing protein n=1 Tax=Microbacterium sp. RU33B TaxID=1907390 RepID=UPI0009772160|nr:nucleotidyltransferase domain-containing protein [Microbacterium sp. RU33B]